MSAVSESGRRGNVRISSGRRTERPRNAPSLLFVSINTSTHAAVKRAREADRALTAGTRAAEAAVSDAAAERRRSRRVTRRTDAI